jgi:RNA polymerase sigma-70 factor (ECF subfamily)
MKGCHHIVMALKIHRPDIVERTDKELVEGCLSRDYSCQEAFYRRFAGKMYALCLRYANDSYEAEDMLQEGFIRVFDYLKQFRFEGSLDGWVRRIIVNTAITIYRKNKKIHLQEDLENVQDEAGDFSMDALDKLQTKDLLKLISRLPEGYRMVFNLYAVEGYSHKEIADMMGISESTSKSQFMKSRRHLLKSLQSQKGGIDGNQ